MDNLIKVYDNVIGDDYCDKLIEKFKYNTQLHQNFDDRGMIFTQITIQKAGWLTDVKFLSNTFQQYFEKYKEDCGIIKQQMPVSYIIEPVRMKRYLANDYDEFKQHVDVNQKTNCTRFLVFFIYLDNNIKGKTIFPNLSSGRPLCRVPKNSPGPLMSKSFSDISNPSSVSVIIESLW